MHEQWDPPVGQEEMSSWIQVDFQNNIHRRWLPECAPFLFPPSVESHNVGGIPTEIVYFEVYILPHSAEIDGTPMEVKKRRRAGCRLKENERDVKTKWEQVILNWTLWLQTHHWVKLEWNLRTMVTMLVS